MTTSATLERTQPASTAVLEFGPFRYEPRRRQVSSPEGPCRIGSRALQLLEVLLENPGRLYSREELTQRVWPRTVVEETSLRVHMSALRRQLGAGAGSATYITNVPGRGYVFVAPVRSIAAPDAAPAALAPMPALPHAPLLCDLPARLGCPLGRDEAIARLGMWVARERLVSVVGPGGVGKTVVALAVAQMQSGRHEHGTCFVDLGDVSEPALAAVEVGRACGVAVSGDDSWAALVGALRSRHLLIVLDNCEHLIDAVAALLDRLMQSCPKVHVIATSREPIGVQGERVFMLPPLDLPEPGCSAAPHHLLAYPAVRLFVERARAACGTFELTEANAAAVTQLCAFLDGMPLAIELAAAHVPIIGVHALADRREDMLDLLTRGRRTAPPRHRTLRALLGWSYALLSETEKRVLQQLCAFPGTFGLEEAMALLEAEGLNLRQGIHDLLELCAKSMLTSESLNGAAPRYRVLNVVRLFVQSRGRAPEEGGQPPYTSITGIPAP